MPFGVNVLRSALRCIVVVVIVGSTIARAHCAEGNAHSIRGTTSKLPGYSVVFRTLSVEQGLSQSTAYSMMQDSRGFMWIATADGLNRYDGVGVKVYRHIPADSTSLTDNFIQVLLEDVSQKKLWIGTHDGGLNCFDYATGVFSTVKNLRQSLPSGALYALVQEPNGVLWIGAEHGLCRYDGAIGKARWFDNFAVEASGRTTSSYTSRSASPSTPRSISISTTQHAGTAVLTLCIDKVQPRCLWIGTPQGLYALDVTTYVVRDMSSVVSNDGSNIAVRALAQDSSGVLWIGTVQGLVCYNPCNGEHWRIYLDGDGDGKMTESSIDAVRTLYVDADGTVWIGTVGGRLYCYPYGREGNRHLLLPTRHTMQSKQMLQAAKQAIKNVQGFGGTAVYSLYQDRTGVLWVGTYSGGVMISSLPARDLFSGAFFTLKHNPQQPASRYYPNRFAVSALCEDHTGILWIGTLDGGLNLYNPSNGAFTVVRQSKESLRNKLLSGVGVVVKKGINLPSDVIRMVYEDRRGIMWIATSHGLVSWHRQNNVSVVYQQFAGCDAFTVFEDRNGGLWVGTLGEGIFYHPPKSSTGSRRQMNARQAEDTHLDSWQVFRHNPAYPTSVKHPSGNIIRAICQDSSGMMWFGTRGAGLNSFDPSTGVFTHYLHAEATVGSLSHNSLYCLRVDKQGRLWVGTQGGGVNCFDATTRTFTALRSTHGLSNNVVYGILEDSAGALWMSTNYGLSKLQPNTSIKASSDSTKAWSSRIVFRTYDVRDGLQSNEFNANAFCKGRNGALYFGGIQGITIVRPERLRENPHPPPVVVTNFKVFDHSLLKRDMRSDDTIAISYTDNFFTFEFAALNFLLPEKNQYRYKLDGVDPTWITIGARLGARHEASYTNIPPGRYVFRVQGSNNDGIWNVRGASVVVIIEPPFWQMTWFRLVAGLVCLGIAVGGVLWRVRSIQRTALLQRQLVQLELQSLRLHMNPHFIFNAMNSIQYLVAEEQNEAAQRYLSAFARLMRTILQHSDHLAISIHDEVEFLRLYGELERLRYDFTFELDIVWHGTSAEAATTFIPVMVIQPYVENAIRHGLGTRLRGGKVYVELVRRGETVYCTVEDNGIGRAKARELQKKNELKKNEPKKNEVRQQTFAYEPDHLSIATSVTQRRLEILNTLRRNSRVQAFFTAFSASLFAPFSARLSSSSVRRQSFLTSSPISVQYTDLYIDANGTSEECQTGTNASLQTKQPAGTRVEIVMPVLASGSMALGSRGH
jgi:ligand-binding sensor domain-containing protein